MARLPQTSTSLLRYLRQQKRVTTRLANATPYALSGTSVTAPGLTKVDDRIVAGTAGGSRVELDSAGLRKYAADGTTVQVDLTGEVAAFSGLITGSEIVGGEFKTAAAGARVHILQLDKGIVEFYSGAAAEYAPATMWADAAAGDGHILLGSPGITDLRTAYLGLWTKAESLVEIVADSIETNTTTLEWAVANGYANLKRWIFVVADATERAALIARYVAAPLSRVIDSTHPLFFWKADEGAGSQLQYTVDGTTFVTIGGGGGGTTLFADPNADRLVFWDDSAGAFAALTASTGLTLTGTDLTVRDATDAQTGIVELATTAETTTGTDTSRAVTPAAFKGALDALTASETVVGIVELATSAEAITGTDTARAVTPAGTKAAIDAAVPGAWTAYTPTWAAATTAPALGNGTLTGAYCRLGRTIHWRLYLLTGSTTTYGSGMYTFTVPTASVNTSEAQPNATGYGYNLTSRVGLQGYHATATTFRVLRTSTDAELTHAGMGVAWGAGQYLLLSGTYEAAS